MASYFAHPSACIDEGAVIGDGTRIWHFCHIMPRAIIGSGCNIGQSVFVDNDAIIGNSCKIQNNVSVYKHVTLEDDVFCGPSMVFTNVHAPRAHIPRMEEARPTLVRRGATLGANCTIVCGVTIGRYAFVGAGSVITRDVPDHALVYGNPGRQRGWVCECGLILEPDCACAACGRRFATVNGRLAPAGSVA